jgi:N-methylhydantoinase A
VPVRELPLTAEDVARYRRDFDAVHEQCHGHAAPDQCVEVVNYRVQAIGVVPRVAMPTIPAADGPVEAAVVGSRPAFFPGTADTYTETPVYARAKLRAGHRLAGPAIVEQYDSTVVVFPGQSAEVDGYGNLLITHGEVE